MAGCFNTRRLHYILPAILLLASFPAFAQTGAVQGHSYIGGTKATVSGINSTNYMNGIIPAATITVYLTGTTTKASIYSDAGGTVLSNPFTSNTASSVDPGGWIFWAATNQGLDVVMSGGNGNPSCTTAPLCYVHPVTLTDVFPTQSLANYLPLSGGTLTGTLNGTSADFSGTVTNGTTNSDIHDGIYSYANFGIKCDGSTDDSTALNSIGTFAAGLGAGKTVTVAFPSNAVCVHSSGITTWLTPNLHIEGNGSRLKFTGTGVQIYLHSASSEVDNVSIRGLVLQGNASATWGIQNDSVMARGALQIIEAQDYSTGCFDMQDTQLMTEMNLTCSSIKATQMGVPQVTRPVTGINLGNAGTGKVFANNRYVNLTIEGVSGTGVNVIQACCGNDMQGTSEDNNIGVQTAALAKQMTWGAFDTESNTTDVVEQGQQNNWFGVNSTSLFHIASTAANILVNGGIINALTIDSGVNNSQVMNLLYGISSGAITISGTPTNVLVRGVQSGTGNPYLFTSYVLQGPSETLAGGPTIWNQTTGNAGSRNYCWSIDGSGYGDVELWGSSTNTGTACFNGTPILGYYPGSGYKLGGPFVTNASGYLIGLTASLTTTAATSDNVTITGMAGTGHCSLTPTNASAATNVATSYVSAKTTNQITVTHTATSGMTYDITCWPN